MKKYRSLVALLITFVFVKPGSSQQIISPDTLSSAAPEFATTITPDGKKIYFNRTSPDRKSIYLMESESAGKYWSTPQLATFTDTTFRELDPFISPEGKRLFFSSNRPLEGRQDYNVWVCEKTADGWGKPQPLPETVNGAGDEIYATVARNGNLYYSKYTGGTAKIYRSEFENGTYLVAEQVLINVPDSVSIANPAISPDEKWLIFASWNYRGLGGADLYICGATPDGIWAKPMNLAFLNSKYNDFAPSFSGDGRQVYFTSEQPKVPVVSGGRTPDEGARPPGDLYQISWMKILRWFSKG